MQMVKNCHKIALKMSYYCSCIQLTLAEKGDILKLYWTDEKS